MSFFYWLMSAWDGTLLELLSSKKVIFIKMCPSNENCGGEITNYKRTKSSIKRFCAFEKRSKTAQSEL